MFLDSCPRCARRLKVAIIAGCGLEMEHSACHVADPRKESVVHSEHAPEADPRDGWAIPGIYTTIGTGVDYSLTEDNGPTLPRPPQPLPEHMVAWSGSGWVQVKDCEADSHDVGGW